MAGPNPVLYLDTALAVGGGAVSLYELIQRLDRNCYEPIVVSYADHGYVDRFRALGAEVMVWNVQNLPDHRPQWVGSARDSRAAQWLRTRHWGSTLYHGTGMAMLVGRRLWPRARALGCIIRERKVKLVHTNIRVGHDREGIMAAWLTGVPCVCHIRDFEQLGWFDRWLARIVTRFIYISEAVQKSHLASGVPRQKGLIIYNGLDVSAFASAVDSDKARASFHLSPCDAVVGIVGRLDTWKGHSVFLQAMTRVRDELPAAKGIIVGDAPPEQPKFREELLALSDKLGLSESLIFSPFRMDVPTIMSSLDVLVLASTSPEPFGRVLIEAMAAGKPVVVTDAGAAREIISDGVQGILVAPGDAEAMARAIIYLLTHRDAALLMGQRGQDRVRERFGMQQYVDSVQSVYRELLS